MGYQYLSHVASTLYTWKKKLRMKPDMCYNMLGKIFIKQAQLGVPHSRIQVELDFILQAGTCQILNFAQSLRQSKSVQGTELNWGGGHRT